MIEQSIVTDWENSPHSSHRTFQQMVHCIPKNREPWKSFQHIQPTSESIDSINTEEQQESPREIPLRSGSSDFPRVESKRAHDHEDVFQEAPYQMLGGTVRSSRITCKQFWKYSFSYKNRVHRNPDQMSGITA